MGPIAGPATGTLMPARQPVPACCMTHMWPLAKKMPRYKVSYVVNVADKLCAVIEGAYLYRLMKLDRRMQPIFA